jgi:hypothetical protein
LPDSRYIAKVLPLIREHRALFLGTTLAGLALRLFFVLYFPAITDDSHIYSDLATNWLQHGVYGQTQGGHPELPVLPSDARLPGYPAFLAVIFWAFGAGNFSAVMLAQILIDLGTCLLIADIARQMISARAAQIAFILAALCPFLANYTAAVLSECLEVFFTALALDCAVAALERIGRPEARIRGLCAATGAAIGTSILLRPDGGILLAAIVLYLVAATSNTAFNFDIQLRPDTKFKAFGNILAAATIIALFALAPLVPWTIRNLHTLHHLQPLAPRYANDSDELVPRGFNRWVKTWMADYVSVEEVYWNVPGDKIDPQKLPARAMESSAQREATAAAIAEYNESQDIAPALDVRFANLAAVRIRAHPVRYYAWLPVLRIADMWLRPRTELLPPDPRWWEFNDDVRHSAVAVGFGLLNLIYVGAALLTIFQSSSRIRWAGLLVTFLLLRSVFLGTLENPEPRYTLEGYPAVIVLAAAYAANSKNLSR